MSEGTLRNMMMKFGQTEQLSVLLGRGRNRVNSAIVEEVSAVVVDASCTSLHGIVCAPTILRNPDMPFFTVRHIMHRIFNFYQKNTSIRSIFLLEAYIQAIHDLERHNPDTWKTFTLLFFFRELQLMFLGHKAFYGRTKPTFILMDKWTRITLTYRREKTPTWSMIDPCMTQKWPDGEGYNINYIL